MTAEDDDYVSSWYVPLEELAADTNVDADEIRRLMLSNRLPLPRYIRSDDTQCDLLELAMQAGDHDALPSSFARQWASPEQAVQEWDDYLSGKYVCLRVVSPASMRRKNELVESISGELERAQPDSADWLERLHTLVDELDEIEPPFAPTIVCDSAGRSRAIG